jgi:hypothetical protein
VAVGGLAHLAVFCQRLFPNKHGSLVFEATCAATSPSKQALLEGQAAVEIEDGQVHAIDPQLISVSPWLELTRVSPGTWPGCSGIQAAIP